MSSILPRSFYERPTDVVARDLLGKILVHSTREGRTSGIVVEAEAYLGEGDPGSHASSGVTPRNRVMFGDPGISYVYFTYGMHYCFNAVAKPGGKAGAVLIRALEPTEGIDLMRMRRGNDDIHSLTSGPAKLTQALAIDKSQNGVDLTGDHLYFTGGPPRRFTTGVSPRIGLSRGGDLPLRFYIENNPHVSRRNR
jgi:DNA-3-methyladenine glycosylase